MQKERYDYQYKILMLGDSGSGKTSILIRYTTDTFTSIFMTTSVSIDLKIKTIKIQDKILKLQIWDTAGQERFRSITESYYRGAYAIVLLYDITNRQSFLNIKNWMESISKNVSSKTKVVLVGNKIDVDKSLITVSTEEGKEVAKQYKISFFECSARKDINIKEIFETVARQLYESRDDIYQIEKKIILENPNLNIKKCC
jgi:Ras-related protein Rab-1A